jgi:hypothetical protein
MLTVAGVGLLVSALRVTATESIEMSKVRSETLACFSQERPPDASLAPDYVGLPVWKAEKKARRTEADGYRVIARNGRCFPSTADLRKDRVNLWIVHGTVIKASIF